MRLDDESESGNFEIQSGSSQAGFGGGGGLGLIGALFPFVFSRFGCGGVVLLGLAFLVFGGLGSIGSLGSGGGQPATTQGSSASGELTDVQRTALRVLGSTERRWTDIFAARGQRYTPAPLVFYTRSGTSGCGAAQSAMGPFYCPTDGKVYLDTEFFDELKQRYNVPGDFPMAYVIAHEVGHHIQNLDGTADQVRRAQGSTSRSGGNALSVKLELQADCYAGVWAANDKNLLEAGDVEEGLRAAQAIGDDALQSSAGQRPVPDSFTHGTSAQREFWLKRGIETGDPGRCDTFSAG